MTITKLHYDHTGGTVNLGTGGYTLTVTGDGQTSGTPLMCTLVAGTNSTVKYTGTNYTDIQNHNYHHLQLSGAGPYYLNGNTTLSGNLTIDSGATLYAENNNDSTVYALTLAGNWTNNGTFQASSGTVTFNGTGTQTLESGNSPFYNLIHSGTGTLSLSNDPLIVANDFRKTGSGTFTAGANNITAKNVILSAGSFNAPSGNFSISGNFYIDAALASFDANSGNIIFAGSNDQIFTTNGMTFNNIELNNSSANDDLIVNGTLKLSGNLTVTDGTLDLGTNSASAEIGGNLTIESAGTFLKGSSLTFTGSGDINDKTTASQDLGNVTIGGTSTIRTLQNNVKMTGLTVNSGCIFVLNGKNLSFSSSAAAVNNGTIRLNGNETLTNVTSLDTDSGTVEYEGDGDATSDEYDIAKFGATTSYYDLIINDLSTTKDTFKSSTAAAINGSLTIISGTFKAPVDTLTISGNFSNSGTFEHSNGTVTFNKTTGTQTLDSGGYNFSTIIHSGAGTLQLTGNPLTVISSFSNNAGTFDLNGQDWVMTGADFSNTGTVQLRGSENLTDVLNDFSQGTWIYVGGSGSPFTVKDFGTGYDYYNLIISAADSSYTFQCANEIKIAGDLTLNDGVFDANGQAVTVEGTATLVAGEYLSKSGTQTFNGDLVLSASGKLTGSNTGTITVGGNITIASGAEFVLPTTLNLAGDWSNSGTVDATTYNSSVYLTGGNQTISGETTFYGLSKTTFTACSLKFEKGKKQTVTAQLTFSGMSGELLSLLSTEDGTQWKFEYTGGSPTLNYLAVRDSYNEGGTLSASNSTGIANNYGWDFGGISNLFWIGPVSGTYYWTDNYWSTTSGGTAAGYYPGSTHTAIFDNNGYSCTLASNETVANLTLQSGYTGTLNFDSGGYTLTVMSDLTVGGGTFDASNGSLDIGGNVAVSGGELKAPTSRDFTVAGNWTKTGGTFTPGAGTVTFDGGSGVTQEITPGSASFYNFTHSGAGTVSLLGDFDVDHTFSNSAGTFDEQNQNVSFGGNWENKNSAAYTRGNGTMTFDGDATLTDSSSNAGNLGIITVTSPATLTLGSDAAADSVTGTGTLNLGAGGYILTLTGSGTPLGINSFQKGTGSTVKYAGSSATTVKAAQYNNLQFSGTGTYSLSGNLTSTYALTGDLTVDNGATLDVSGNNYGIELAGNFTNSGTFTARSGTVTFSGGSGVTQTLTPGSSGFYDIAHSGAGTLRLEGDLSVYSISNTGIFELNGKNWTMTGGSLSNDGTVRLQGNEALNGLSQDADSGTWEYVGDGDGTSETFDILDSGSGDFYNLIINDTHATKDTFRATAPLKIYNDFTVSGGTYYANGQATTVDGACAVNTGGTYTAGSGTQIFNGLLSISGGTFTGGTGAIAANGGLSMTSGTLTAPSGAFTAGGDWTISGGTFNPGTGTVNFNKSSGTQTLTPGGKSFYNLTHSGNGTLTLGGALTVTGTLTHSAGTFDAGANAIDANGNVTLSSGTFTAPSSTFNIGGNLDLTYLSTFNANNGTIIFDGSASQSLTTNSKTFNHIELNNTGTSGNDKLTVSGNLDINGNFTLTDGTLDLAANNPDVRLAGNLSVAADAAITKGTGYFYFDGASAQTWSDLSSGQDLGNVQIEGNVSTITNVTAEKITIKAAKSLDITDDTLTLTGTANLLVNFGTFTATDSTVVYTGSGATITIPQVPYHHLTLSPSTATTFKLYGNLTGSYALTGDLTIGNNATLDVIQGTSSHYDIELAGNWTNNGTFTARTGTVTFTGGTGVTQALKSGGSGFCKLTHSGAGTLELQDALTVTNTLTNSAGTFTAGSNQIDANGKVTLSGGTFNAPSTNFYISGNEFNLTNLTDFNDNDGTVIFDNFSGTLLVSDGKSLGNVQIGSSTSGGELILGDPASFTGNLTVEAGNTTSFTLGGFVLTFSGQTFDLTNLDTFDTAGSTVVFSGTSAQEVTSNSLAYDILRVTNTTAAVKFLDAFTANTFRATGGNSEIRFKENTAYGITTLDINGQSSATRIILDSIDQTNSFTIALTSSQTVYYVDARNSDAIGDSINAQNSVGTNCNSNWIFGGSGVTRYWVGPVSSGLWNDNNYWAETSGGTGGFSSPGSGDTAIFDGGNVNDCTLDADVTIYQLTLASGYSGTLDTGIYDLTITQNAEIAGGTLTVGTGKTLGVDATLTVSGGLLDGQNGIIDANHIAITGGELKAPASGDFFVSGDWTHTGGTLTHDNGEITFTGGAPATIDVNSNETFYDLTFEKDDGVAITLAAGDSVIATGVLTLSDGKVDAETGAKMEAQNNANVSSSFDGGTAPLHFTGTADQNFNLTAATDKFDGNITVNKTSGTVQLISDLLMNASGQDFTLTDGTFDANGYDLSIEDALTIANGQLNIPADSGLSVGGLMTVSGGTLNAGGGAVAANGGVMLSGGTLIAPATGLFVVKGDWTNSGGTFTSGTGTVTFGDTSSQNLTSNGESFYNLTHSGSGTLTLQDTLNVANDLTNSAGTIDTNGKNVAVGQDLNVNTGTFTGGTGSLDVNRNVVIASGATLIAPTGTFTVAGDWTKGGTFAHSNGTVTFDGTDQAITGSSTFCNLSKINSGTLTFAAGSTQIIAGALSLKGSSGNLLTLKSSIPGASWNIDPQGTRDVTCVDVGDSNNLNATKINAVDSTDSGNNTNWEFTSSTPDNSSSEPPSNVSEIVSIINGNITNTTSGGTPDQSQGGGSDQGGDSGGEGGGGPDGSNDDDQNSGSSGSQDSESGDSDQSESDSSTGETEQESSNETSSGESEESSSENEEDSSSEESENNETQGQEESGNESSQGAPNLNDLNATIDDFFGRPEQFTSGIDVVEGGENAVYTINNDNSFTANYLSGGEHGAVNFTGGIPPVDLPNFDNPQNVVTTVNCEEGEVHVRSRGSDGLPTLDSVQGGDSGTFTWNQ
ncbi:MAG TPA: hypothetical protein PKL97_05915 [Candidatus Omnitrophota bacterium]|nr:hypothetical protein [Candidatus Omnitrophota bacterium]